MKTIILGITIFFLAVTANANDKKENLAESDNSATVVLSGSIADENSGESLVGVEVKIDGTDLKTYTDFDGNFSFKNIKPGDYKLTANYISYEKKSSKLELSSKQNDIKIKLHPSN